MDLKGKFGHHSLKIAKKKGNYMIRIITTKRLKGLQQRIAELTNLYKAERHWKDIAEQDKSIALELRKNAENQIKNLEKKVMDQREVIVNMMILLDFFSQKILKQQKQTKQPRRKK